MSFNPYLGDLKPENLLMDLDGNICVTDFGFSKQLEEDEDTTYTMGGTPAYMAPEIIQRTGHGIS